MRSRTNNNALFAATNGPANARTWLAAMRYRLLNVTQSEYLTASELSQWLHDQWLDHPEDFVDNALVMMVADGFVQAGHLGNDVIFRCPQERLDRYANGTPAAACGGCGGWTSMGGCSQHADGPQGCQCDPCRIWSPKDYKGLTPQNGNGPRHS